MKPFGLFFALFLIFAGCSTQKAENSDKPENEISVKTDEKSKQFVLVELFTSEGCSSCPPADQVLARLESEQPAANVEIVPLALHVDYWNYLGWRDDFSSNAFSQRQTGYAERFKLDAIYTPQMVVDGQTQFVGSDFDVAVKYVKESAKIQKAAVELAVHDKKLSIKIKNLPTHEVLHVWLAITEDKLRTDVRRGENSGKKLSHAAIVRTLNLIGTMTADKREFEKSENLIVQPAWKKENINLVVFVQGENSKNIFAVGKVKLI